MIDTHAHLSSLLFKDDIEEVIQRARENLKLIISQTTNYEDLLIALDILKRHKGFIKLGIGLHPEEVAKMYLKEKSLEMTKKRIEEEMKKQFEVYIENEKEIFSNIGEIGLDYYMFQRDNEILNLSDLEKKELIELQKYSLEKYVLKAIDLNLPVVLHSREIQLNSTSNLNFYDFTKNRCLRDIIEILNRVEKSRGKKVKAVFHCFSYVDFQIAKDLLESGYYISFTNIINYPKSDKLLELAKVVLREYPNLVMFETDAPYLPPVDKRGKRCEPSDVRCVYESLENEGNIVDNNCNIFFSFT